MFADPKKTQIPSSKPNFFQRAQRTVNKQFSKVNQRLFPTVGTGTGASAGAMKNPARMGLNPLKNTIKNLFKKLPGKNMLAKLLGTVGLKGGLGTVLKRFGGPIGTFIFALAMGEGIGNALLSTAGFAAGAAIGQVLIPIPILGGLIGGLLGEFLLKKMFNFAKKFLGKLFGKKDQELQKNVEVSSSGLEISKSEKTYTKAEIEALNAGASMDAAGNVIPINKNGDKATQISDVPEEKPEIITIPMGGATGGGQGVSAPPQKSSNALPTINFDTNNPHTLYATSVTGAGN